MRRLIWSAMLLVMVGPALAQDTRDTKEAQQTQETQQAPQTQEAQQAQSPAHILTAPTGMKWGPPPPMFNQAAKFTVLAGDPSKEGLFTVRLKMPAGYKIMPHTHPTAEYLTVLSGALRVGMTRDWQDASMKELPAGGFAHMLAQAAHYVQARGETLIQVSGQAPFTITYINPADDPRKSSTKPTTSASR